MNSINPNNDNFKEDPWCYDVPLDSKPTFLNMGIDNNIYRTKDFINDSSGNVEAFMCILSDNLNSPIMTMGFTVPSKSSMIVFLTSRICKIIFANVAPTSGISM